MSTEWSGNVTEWHIAAIQSPFSLISVDRMAEFHPVRLALLMTPTVKLVINTLGNIH